MTDLDAILATVLDRPEDDIPRLVYADALEENGEPANVTRAEFIRVQCELAFLDDGGDEPNEESITATNWAWAMRDQRIERLRHRELELWGYLPRRDGVLSTFNVSLPGVAVLLGSDGGTGLGNEYPWAIVRRGFVAEVRGPLALLRGGDPCPHCDRGVQWRSMPPDSCVCESCGGDPALRKPGTGRTPGLLRELVRREPVERVEVTDKSPMNEDGWFKDTGSEFSHNNQRHTLPADLWTVCNRLAYDGSRPTKMLAVERLSHALLLEAKQKATVPA